MFNRSLLATAIGLAFFPSMLNATDALNKADATLEKMLIIGSSEEAKTLPGSGAVVDNKQLETEVATGALQNVEQEFGDVMFALVNYARFLKIDPESALERTNKKFMSRFQIMEKLSRAKGLDLKDMSLEEMENLWQQSKKL